MKILAHTFLPAASAKGTAAKLCVESLVLACPDVWSTHQYHSTSSQYLKHTHTHHEILFRKCPTFNLFVLLNSNTVEINSLIVTSIIENIQFMSNTLLFK